MADQRHALHAEFHKRYDDLIKFIANLPINHNFRSIIAVNFDTGMLWTREAIMSIEPTASVEEEIKLAS
jgi:hypothetical protein